MNDKMKDCYGKKFFIPGAMDRQLSEHEKKQLEECRECKDFNKCSTIKLISNVNEIQANLTSQDS